MSPYNAPTDKTGPGVLRQLESNNAAERFGEKHTTSEFNRRQSCEFVTGVLTDWWPQANVIGHGV